MTPSAIIAQQEAKIKAYEAQRAEYMTLISELKSKKNRLEAVTLK